MLFESDRLLVRRLTEEDAEALFAVLSDPEVMRYIEPSYSMEGTRTFIREAGLCEPPQVYAVLWKDSASEDAAAKPEGTRQSASFILIGHLIWHPWGEDSMELGWILRRDYWGRGIAGELTAAMLAQTDRDVVIECSPGQSATRRIAESFGFELVSSYKELLVYRRHI